MKRVLPIVARVLLGLLFIAGAIGGLMGDPHLPEGEAAQAFMGTLLSSGLFPVVKVFELVSGLALLSGFFVPLATAVLAPIIFNIAFYHLSLDPVGVPVVVVLVVLWAGVARSQWQVFAPFFRPKASGS